MKMYPDIYSRILRGTLRLGLRSYLNIRHRFLEPIPPGPKVFAVNHPTVWDAFPVLGLVTTDFVRTLIEEQVWSFFLPRLIFTLGNQIVLHRGEKSNRSIEDSLFVLSRGGSVLIAPEGERTAPSQRVRARRGVARLAVGGRATVIPVGAWIDERDIFMRPVRYRIQGVSYTVDSWFPRFRADYGVVFGRPMRLDAWFDRELSMDDYQAIASEVLERIYELRGQAQRLFVPESPSPAPRRGAAGPASAPAAKPSGADAGDEDIARKPEAPAHRRAPGVHPAG